MHAFDIRLSSPDEITHQARPGLHPFGISLAQGHRFCFICQSLRNPRFTYTGTNT